MSLRDEVWSTARAIGLEKSEATLQALNDLNVGKHLPINYLPEHLELVGAWSEAVELLRHDPGCPPPPPRPSRRRRP